MNFVLMSIHKRHADNILDGLKDLELRKTAPETPCVLFLYETKNGDGAGAVVGMAICHSVLTIRRESSPPWSGRNVALAKRACITTEDFEKYLGYGTLRALELEKALRFNPPIELKFFGLERAPQSWQYIRQKPREGGANMSNSVIITLIICITVIIICTQSGKTK